MSLQWLGVNNTNSEHLLGIYHVPGTKPSILHTTASFVLTTALRGICCHPHPFDDVPRIHKVI